MNKNCKLNCVFKLLEVHICVHGYVICSNAQVGEIAEGLCQPQGEAAEVTGAVQEGKSREN